MHESLFTCDAAVTKDDKEICKKMNAQCFHSNSFKYYAFNFNLCIYLLFYYYYKLISKVPKNIFLKCNKN